MRLDGWESRLNDFRESKRHIPFQWGVNDCYSLADGALAAQLGQSPISDWSGTYSSEWGCLLNYRRKLKRMACEDIISAMDQRMSRADVWLPSRGAICGRCDGLGASVMSIAFGVVVSDKIAFVGYDGLVFDTVKATDIFWSAA